MGRAMQELWGLVQALRDVSFAGATDYGIVERIAPGRDTQSFWPSYCRHLQEMIAERADWAPLPGVVALLDSLREHGVRLGLLTGNIRSGAEIKLRSVGLWERFDLSLSGFAEDGREREAISEAVLRRCGAHPRALVGDSVADVRCARHVGVRVLCVATGPQPSSMLAGAAPDRLVDDLTATDDLVAWLLAPPPRSAPRA